MSRRKNIVNFDYEMNGAVLGRTDSNKDLGIDITYNLVWNDHIRRVVSKCNKKMGMVKHAIGFNAPEKVSQTLFTALIRSDVEYGSPLWSGTSKRNLQLLEGVQRRATNYILCYPDQDYDGHLTKLDLSPLSYRREINDLCFFFRGKLELYELHLNHFVVFNYTLLDRPNTKSSDDPLLLVPQFCKTESHKASFFFSIGLFLCGINFHFQLELLPVWLPSRVSLLSSTSSNSVMVLIHTIHALGCLAVSVLIAGPHNSVVFPVSFCFPFLFLGGWGGYWWGRGVGDLSLFLILVGWS